MATVIHMSCNHCGIPYPLPTKYHFVIRDDCTYEWVEIDKRHDCLCHMGIHLTIIKPRFPRKPFQDLIKWITYDTSTWKIDSRII
jgi:hypothetical protein